MNRSIRTGLVAVALMVFAGGAWNSQVTLAQAAPRANAAQAKRERHPVLQASIRQLEGVKDRLAKAPTDFGGHRESAVDAINHAINELHQALQFDNKK